jgi:DNA-binding response OmpR family regulator
MRILLAEDEAKVAAHIAQGLKAEGYAVDLAADGDEAVWLAENYPYDLVLLDIMMPGRDGVMVLRHLRRKGLTVPVIFLTARGEPEDRVNGLDAGADDYLVKPFLLSELLARIRAVLRRQRPQPTNFLRVADLELDLLSRKARRGGQEIELTNREYALLELLMTQSPKVMTKSAIIEHVWDQHFDSGTNVVNVYMNYLRRKVDLPGMKPLLHTVRGIGFTVREDPP